MKNNHKTYTAALIGCGRIGCGFDDDPKRRYIATHAKAYHCNNRIKLVALADIDRERIDKYAQKYNVPKTYLNYKEMLITERPEILSICTWNDSHHEIINFAIENGVKAIFCEKPIADTIAAAKEIIKLCHEKNIILQVNHSRRFDPTHQKIKEYINKDKLGRIQQVNFYYTGGIANTGSHIFDILRFFLGDVNWIQAIESENKSPNKNDPNFDGWLKFKSGILCTIQACDVEEYFIADLTLLGTKGKIKITNGGFKIEYYHINDSDLFSEYKELYKSETLPFDHTPINYMMDGVNHLINCLDYNLKPICSGEDGLAALELVCAFHESARNNGNRIFLPLQKSDIKINSM